MGSARKGSRRAHTHGVRHLDRKTWLSACLIRAGSGSGDMRGAPSSRPNQRDKGGGGEERGQWKRRMQCRERESGCPGSMGRNLESGILKLESGNPEWSNFPGFLRAETRDADGEGLTDWSRSAKEMAATTDPRGNGSRGSRRWIK